MLWNRDWNLLRGWIGPSRYLSAHKQRKLLELAGVSARAIYEPDEWEAFVTALRREAKDRAVVADLRIFGSRRKLVEAAEAVAAKGATLSVVERGTVIDMPTLREVDRTLTIWRGESAMKNPKRAKAMSERGNEARRKKRAEGRMEAKAFELRWRDEKRFPSVAEALDGTGWTKTTAWRHFGPRERNSSN